MRYEELMELRIHKTEDGSRLFAYQGDVWIIDDNLKSGNPEFDNFLQDFANKTNIDLSQRHPYELNSIDSVAEYITDERPDIVTGYLDDDKLFMSSIESSHHPYTSNLLKKISKQLNVDIETSEYSELDYEKEVMHYRHEIMKEFPDSVFHGTSLENAIEILKTGIQSTDNSNWENIKTHGVLFFTVKYTTAEFHSVRTADIQNSIPVILEFSIPDKNKIVPDYDIAAMLGTGHEGLKGSEYEHTDFRAKTYFDSKNLVRPEKFWKNFSEFGYKGRVPPKFIKYIHTPFSEDFKETGEYWYIFDVEDFKHAVQIYNEIGYFDSEFLGMSYDEFVKSYNEEDE